jgi:hypothetical protein
MPLTTVVNVTAGGKRAICSCSWEGDTIPGTSPDTARAAWREANRHARDAHGGTAGRPRSETASNAPGGETR